MRIFNMLNTIDLNIFLANDLFNMLGFFKIRNQAIFLI